MIQAIEQGNANALRQLLGEDIIAKAEKVDLSLLKSEEINKSLEVPALGDSSHCEDPQWRVHSIGQAVVRCEVFRSSRKKNLFNMHSDRLVPKNKQLKFTVKTNVNEPYEVKWQVVNTGAEAGADLRGNFCDSDFKNGKWERTRYRGTHWIEAFAIKDGVCMARSGKYYIKIRNSLF